jgi:hypothetical protein
MTQSDHMRLHQERRIEMARLCGCN